MRTWFLLAVLAIPACADMEDRSTETRTFANVHLLILDNISGSIDVTGYNGRDVQMEVSKHIRAESSERLEAAKREVKLDEQQSGDTLKLFVDGPFRSDHHHGHDGYNVTYNFNLRVPSSARVDLYTVNGNHIVASNIGDFDVRNVNGKIELTGVSGSGTAKTVNGAVKVVFARNPTTASSFDTINGAVDVTFRPGLSADVRMETMHGGMYTDFEVGALPLQPATAERQNGRYVYKHGGATGVRIGHGGIELKMKTINGDIFVRDGDRKQ